MKQNSQRVVLVTGSSSGIGRACCDRLANNNRRVYGASRTAVTAPCWSYVKMDVREDHSVDNAIESILRRDECIDEVVHCAGFSLAGPFEETTVEEARAQFETNYFGTVRVLRAVLPIMRRQANGKIVVIGSIAGVIALPYVCHYAASKFALDGLIEAVRYEVDRFGIEITILHPGDFDTALGANQVCSQKTDANSPYFAEFRRLIDLYAASMRGAPSPDTVARSVERLLNLSRMPARVCVGSGKEVAAVWLKSTLPTRLFSYLFRKSYSP